MEQRKLSVKEQYFCLIHEMTGQELVNIEHIVINNEIQINRLLFIKFVMYCHSLGGTSGVDTDEIAAADMSCGDVPTEIIIYK